jgi:hypothetical protein
MQPAALQHGRLANAARALHNLARSPVIGVGADPRLAANGGARCLHVAAARLLQYLERLKAGDVGLYKSNAAHP